jgi:glycosyltransferase involved in cell wall biosynthesis
MGNLLTPAPDKPIEAQYANEQLKPARLSVLIPVYNYRVSTLVNELYTQLNRYSEWEIRVYDDAGKLEADQKNCKLNEPPLIIYKRLSENLGRSGIRLLLASDALYEKILFIDADSEIKDNKYIQKYLIAATQSEVITGGTAYRKEMPEPAYRLRWYYGKKREVIPAAKRQLTPYEHISLNNILFAKSAFNRLQFNDEIKGYGHEDTLLALQCKKLKINILHIDNPVIHTGLEQSSLFLDKSLEAVNNFFRLKQMGYDLTFSGLEGAYQKLKKFHLEWLFLMFVHLFRDMMIRNLTSPLPYLRWLDMLKLEKYVLLHRAGAKK